MKKSINKSTFSISLSLIAITLFLLTACKKSEDKPTPPANEVWMENTAYNPQTLTVAKNTTVKWTNKEDLLHTVTSMGGFFDSGDLSNGATFTFTFDSIGTFDYQCLNHSGMAGTIVVQ